MKYSLKELIGQIEKPNLSQYKKFTPLFIAEAEKGLNWTEWDKDVFDDYFEKAHNSVAYLGQGVLRPHHKEVIKKNWMKTECWHVCSQGYCVRKLTSRN